MGRMTTAVHAGGWVKRHNMVRSARNHGNHERAWYETAETPGNIRVVGTPRTTVGESPLFDAARTERLARSIDVVRERFGDNAITRARLLADAPHRRFDFGEKPTLPDEPLDE